MRRSAIPIAVVSCLTAAALLRLTVGCLDTTPIVVEKEAASPTNTTCVPCLELREGCLDIVEACSLDTKCRDSYRCMGERQCLNLPTLDLKIECGLECVRLAGVTTHLDPVVQTYFAALVECGARRCGEACNIPDGGLPSR